MQYEVINNAKRNIVWGFVNKLLLLLCPFVTRTIVRYFLGIEYLGLDSLFAAIISVLSLSELGLSSAIIFHMYKPVSEGNVLLVNALLNFYRKAYRIIGIIILIVGVCVIPFLHLLIHDSYPSEIILWKVYLIFLFNTVVSYFMYAYLSPLITVYQRDDINSNINSLITILLTISRLGLLFLTKDYYCYIIATPFFTILSNLLTAYSVRKNYPQYKCEGKLPKEIYDDLKKLIAGTFIQKACGLTRNSLDSICTSVFLGLTMTAVYNNYFYISSAITGFVGIIAVAFAGGVGNHVATKTVEENFDELQKLDFIYLSFSGWASVCLFCLYQPFMRLWMGDEYLLKYSSVSLFCVYFYLLKLGDIRSLYNSANGLWWEQRWRAIIETVLNLILNLILGKIFGINGIIVATIISLVVCNCIWSTGIIFKRYFSITKLIEHFRSQIFYSIINFIVLISTFLICSFISTDNDIIDIFIRIIICLIIPNLIYYVIYHRTKMFKESINLIRGK